MRPLTVVEAEVARLLRHPLPSRVPRAAGNPDATARMRDEEEHIEATQQDRLDGEEVTSDDARRCDRRNSRQLGPPRRGAGSRPARASSRRMLVAETMKPSLRNSPQIRR